MFGWSARRFISFTRSPSFRRRVIKPAYGDDKNSGANSCSKEHRRDRVGYIANISQFEQASSATTATGTSAELRLGG